MGSLYFENRPPFFSSNEFRYDLTAGAQTPAKDCSNFASKFSCGSTLSFYVSHQSVSKNEYDLEETRLGYMAKPELKTMQYTLKLLIHNPRMLAGTSFFQNIYFNFSFCHEKLIQSPSIS